MSVTASPESAAAIVESQVEVPRCKSCGHTDASLRATVLQYAASALFFSVRRTAWSGIFCAKCRRRRAAIATSLSAIFGWWGIPWGPVFTTQVIYRNSRGGAQDDEFNALILQEVAKALVQQGNTPEALRAIEAAAERSSSLEVQTLLASIRGYG